MQLSLIVAGSGPLADRVTADLVRRSWSVRSLEAGLAGADAVIDWMAERPL